MFTSRDFLRVEYNVLSKNVTRNVSQSEKLFDFFHFYTTPRAAMTCLAYQIKCYQIHFFFNK
jgi:hypothetical protein